MSLREAGAVKLGIYDVAGRRVRKLIDGTQPAGRKTVTWDGRGDSGSMLAPGYYLVRFQAPGVVQTRSVWLVR
jgi:flagellar hook assembly protein FlgD